MPRLKKRVKFYLTYSHIHNLPITNFRFFTVYGPWGRPDMALFKFVKGIVENKPIDIFNNGEMKETLLMSLTWFMQYFFY